MFGPSLARSDTSGLAEEYLQAAGRCEGYAPGQDLNMHLSLQQILNDLVEHGHLNSLGQLITPYYFMQILRLRLRVQKIAERAGPGQPVRQPLFILGLPRTGSSLLHELLSLHPHLRAPTFWASHHWPRHDWRDTVSQTQTRAQLLAVNTLAPDFRHIHRLAALAPHECVSIQAQTFRSMQFHAAFRLPGYNAAMLQPDYDWLPAYQWHARYLGLLQQAGQRWVLKAPGHMLGLSALQQIYPDARFIQTHRNPMEVIPSMASLTLSLRKITSNLHDLAEIGTDVLHLWQHAIGNVMRTRTQDEDTNQQFYDVDYRRLVKRPVTELQRLTAHFELPWTDAYELAVKSYLARQPKPARHNYSPAKFHLHPDRLAAAFTDYQQQYLTHT